MASIATIYKAVTNLGKIKEVLSTIFNVVDKILKVITVVNVNSTSDNVIARNIPLVISTLGKIKELIVKFGPLVGFKVDTSASALSEGDPKKELTKALVELEKLLK